MNELIIMLPTGSGLLIYAALELLTRLTATQSITIAVLTSVFAFFFSTFYLYYQRRTVKPKIIINLK